MAISTRETLSTVTNFIGTNGDTRYRLVGGNRSIPEDMASIQLSFSLPSPTERLLKEVLMFF
jgi:hypothetical protein